VITHPGSRTRALYLWESDDLKRRPGVRQLRLCEDIILALRFSFHFPIARREGMPSISSRDLKGDPRCYGRSEIILTRQDHLNITLLHELTHALGYGSPDNPHSRGFMLQYIDALSWWFSWDADELKILAHQQGLI
jgi:hypothetical protein